MALTFRHTETGVPITIGVLLQADRSERTESVKSRFVARGYAFSFADFIERDADGDEFVVTHDELVERLKKICGKEFTHHSTAGQFVAEFLTAMRPRSSPESRLFLRSFNNTINDTMRRNWASRGASNPVPASTWQNAIYSFRTWGVYLWIIRTGRLRVVPFLFAVISVVAVLGFVSHLLFNVADSTGAFCKETDDSRLRSVNLGIPQAALPFDTRSLCSPTGLRVQAGYRYEIVFTVNEPWRDASIETTPIGYTSASQPLPARWYLRAAAPLRRILFRRWYMAVARIGATGVDEYFLDPVRVRDSAINAYRAFFTARRSGEVFVYVNDAAIALPGLVSTFYKNNSIILGSSVEKRNYEALLGDDSCYFRVTIERNK